MRVRDVQAILLGILAGLGLLLAISAVATAQIGAGMFAPMPLSIAPNKVKSATLEQWYEANSGVSCSGTCSNGGTVSQWSDQSGNGYNATVAGSPACTAGPTYETGMVNGLPAIAFPGTAAHCLHDGYTGDPGTIAAVFFPLPTAANTPFPYWYLACAPSASAMYAYCLAPYGSVPSSVNANAANLQVRMFDHGSTGSTSATTWPVFTGHQGFVWDLMIVTNSGTVLKSYAGDVLLSSVTIPSGKTPLAPVTGQYIGTGIYNGSLDNPFAGDLAEFITFNGVLSGSDQLGLVRYLQQKYGLGWGNAGNYLATFNNYGNVGGYGDLGVYMARSKDGIHFPQPAPVNVQPEYHSGHGDGALGWVLLHDTNGNLVKYNGLYWAMSSSAFFKNMTYPYYLIDFYTSSQLPGTGESWTYQGDFSCSGNPVTPGSNAGCFNDEWFIDPGNANQVSIIFNASNTEASGTAEQEYEAPITLNSNGTFSVGTVAQITGTALPTNYYAGQINYVGSTYYYTITDETDSDLVRVYTSSSPFSGYATLAATYGTAGGIDEWPDYLQASGSGTYYVDSNNAAVEKYATFTDGAMGTVTLSGYTTMSVANSGWPSNGSVNTMPQAFNVYKLPVRTLP